MSQCEHEPPFDDGPTQCPNDAAEAVTVGEGKAVVTFNLCEPHAAMYERSFSRRSGARGEPLPVARRKIAI